MLLVFGPRESMTEIYIWHDVQHRWRTCYDGLELELESVFSCGVSGSRSGPICLSSSSSILSFALTTCHKEGKDYHSQENNSDQSITNHHFRGQQWNRNINKTKSTGTCAFKLLSLWLQWVTSTWLYSILFSKINIEVKYSFFPLRYFYLYIFIFSRMKILCMMEIEMLEIEAQQTL